MAKATFDEVIAAREAIPYPGDMGNVVNRNAYFAATRASLYELGWTEDEFLDVLIARIRARRLARANTL
jgi:hypothetical protein